MSTSTVDYTELAKQAGAISSTPAGGAMDYAAPPEELQGARDTYLETTRMTPAPWQGSTPENWHVRVLQQYFPDVQIPAAMLKRFEKARSVPLSSLLQASH